MEWEDHFRSAAECGIERERLKALGVAEWLEQFLDGRIQASYEEIEREELEGTASPPTGGSEYMEGDGLG